MTDNFDELKRDYRAISAPPFVATRIRASNEAPERPARWWIPAAVAASAVLAVLWLTPFTSQVTNNAVAKDAPPSMSTLAALKPDKPAMASPSFGQLRSFSVPGMPARPIAPGSSDEQTNNTNEHSDFEEIKDAHG